MNPELSTPAALLDALLVAPEGERPAIVRTAGPVDAVLSSLSDEAERLAVVEVNRALAASAMVIELTDRGGSTRTQARARRARAHALAYSGRFPEALSVGRDAIQLAEQSRDPVEAARALLGSIHSLSELGRYDEAVKAGDQARTKLLDAGEPLLAARADINLGIVHQNRDDPQTALVHLDRAREMLRDDANLLGFIENSRGEALLLLNEFASAETSFLSALHGYESGGFQLLATIVEGNLAELAVRQGLLQRALYHFERARRRLEQDGAGSHLARLLAEHADALESLGAAEEALAGYESALPRLRAHGLTWETGRALAGLGKALIRLGRRDEAIAALAESAAIFQSMGHAGAGAKIDLIRSELETERGRPDVATELAARALAAVKDRPADAAIARYHVASLALRRNDVAGAEVELAAAIPTVERLDIAPLLADMLHLRARLKQMKGDLRGAIADLRRSVEQVERIRGAFQAEGLRAAFLSDRLRVYEDLVRFTLDSGDAASVSEAFSVVERAKSRSLLDVVRGVLDIAESSPHDASDPGEAKLLAELARIRSELSVLYSRLAPRGPADQRAVADAAWQEAVHERESTMTDLERRVTTTRGVAGLFAQPISLDDAQRAIPHDAALIEYFTADDEVMAFVLRHDAAHVVRRLGAAAEIRDRVARLQFQLRRPVRPGARSESQDDRMLSGVRRELHALWETLVRDLKSPLHDCRRLIVVPHGPLHVVPFHALWDGESHLISHYEVSYMPSASLFLHANGKLPRCATTTGEGDSIVVGVADEAAPGIADEAKLVAHLLSPSRVLLNEEATLERFSASVSSASTIHLACHGRYSRRSPMASGLRLADRWLTVRDVYGLNLSADLVTLSGCDTGRNLVTAGDELLGLMRGFLATGVRSLLVSLWVASDAVTAALMGDFYRRWRGRRGTPISKAEALRQAQLEAMSRHPHPAFWAPFILVGGT